VDDEEKKAAAAAAAREGKGGVDDRDDDDDDDEDFCRTRLGTARMRYHWIYNSYSTSNNRERRGKCSGIIIICMVPIGQNIIRRTRHTILI